MGSWREGSGETHLEVSLWGKNEEYPNSSYQQGGKGWSQSVRVCVRARVWRVDSSYLDICSILKKLQLERKEVVWTFHLLPEFYEEEFWRISTFLKQDKTLAVTDWSMLSFGIYSAFVKNSINSHGLAFSI